MGLDGPARKTAAEEILRGPEQFSDAKPTTDEAERLSGARTADETGENSITVTIRLARSCAGWRKRPTSRDFHYAVTTEKPTNRQRAILYTFAQEAEWHELIAAWAEGAFTLRSLVAALHRAGDGRCRAARHLNRWTTATAPTQKPHRRY